MEYATFSNPKLVAILVPAILLLAGALAKKLVRASGWMWQDFYLGIEFTLAALSSGLVYIFDLVKVIATKAPGADVRDKLSYTALFLCVTFFLFLYVLGVHQDWEKAPDATPKRIRLGFVANFVGGGLLAAFILLIKGTA
ncbi:MAG TPA: hypothetical protein VGL53_30650 [Bryobacteraceae bacterium]|jgi:hypothetical protein